MPSMRSISALGALIVFPMRIVGMVPAFRSRVGRIPSDIEQHGHLVHAVRQARKLVGFSEPTACDAHFSVPPTVLTYNPISGVVFSLSTLAPDMVSTPFTGLLVPCYTTRRAGMNGQGS